MIEPGNAGLKPCATVRATGLSWGRASALPCLLLIAASAHAQSRAGAARLETGVQISWSGEDDLGSQSALLTRNSPTDQSPFVLFATSARVRSGSGVAATVGYRLTRWLTVEAAGRMRHADVALSIAADAEAAPDRTILAERLTEYAIDGSALVRLPIHAGPRLWPFAFAGGGYRRELHADRAAVDDGSSIHAGAGLKWLIASPRSGRVKGVGVRGDGRVTLRRGGFHLDRATGRLVVVAAGVFLVF